MKRMIFLFIAAALSLAAADVDMTPVIRSMLPGSQVQTVERSEMSGWYRVYTGKNMFYVNPFEEKIFFGKLYTLGGRDLTTPRMEAHADKKDALAKAQEIGAEAMMSPYLVVDHGEGERPYSAIVFTDPDCPLCKQIEPFFRENGVRVAYQFFPLERLHPAAKEKCLKFYSAEKLESVIGSDPATIEVTELGRERLDKSLEFVKKIGVPGTPMTLVVDNKTMKIIALVRGLNLPLLSRYFKGSK